MKDGENPIAVVLGIAFGLVIVYFLSKVML